MSGGVDSSVAAALLVDEGYSVYGFTLKLWDAEDDGHSRKPCCTVTMARDAGRVCRMLGIPHYTLDMREEFRREVIERFESDYLSGRTPNPCVQCNSRIKWGEMWTKVRSMGMNLLATGHYARIERTANGGHRLLTGVDGTKDQSYFLWEIPFELLSSTIFPTGNLTKTEVRAIAARLELPVAEKEESQEVCFIPDDDYRSWLLKRNVKGNLNEYSGDIVDNAGNVLGTHDGYPLFTIGQRKGLGLGGGSQTLYVESIDPVSKRVQVGPVAALTKSEFTVGSLNWLCARPPDKADDLLIKIRYRQSGVPASIDHDGNGVLTVRTNDPVEAVTPGQSAVFYKDQQVIGGGIIL